MLAITYYALLDIKWIGISIGIFGIVLAVTRVISGLHFTIDVVVGALCGIGAGIVGYFII